MLFRSLLVLGPQLEEYLANRMTGPFVNWEISKGLFTDLNQYEKVIILTNLFEKDPPNYIYDPENTFKNILDDLIKLAGIQPKSSSDASRSIRWALMESDFTESFQLFKSCIEDVLDDEFGFSELEILDDTKEIMYPYENGKQPTIEVYEFKGKDLDFNNCSFEIVWDNVNGKS